MYNYKFESIDYEEQYSFELAHWKKFSKDELNEMVLKAIRIYVERDFSVDGLYPLPCYMDIGDLFFDDALKNTLIKDFGFKSIEYEQSIAYGGEALFGDDFRHRDGTNFKEIFKDVKVPKCVRCSEDECRIENERF